MENFDTQRADKLRAAHRDAVDRAQQILDRASNEHRALNAVEDVEFRQCEDDMRMIAAEIEVDAQRRAAADRAARVIPDDVDGAGKRFNVNIRTADALDVNVRDLQRLDATEARGRGLAFLERAAERNFLGGHDHLEDIAALMSRDDGELGVGATVGRLALATASTEYARAWKRYLTVGEAGLREQERALLDRAMTAGTGNTGGYFVPLYLDPTMIVTGAGTYNEIRSIADVRQISTLTFNGVTAAQITASEVGEGSAFSDNAPTVGQLQFSMLKAGAYVPASFEAFEDIEGLANDVGRLIIDAKANYEGQRLTVGTGSGQPNGVVHQVAAVGGSKVAPATGGAFVVGDVYKTHQSLPARFRRNNAGRRAFMANVNIINQMRQFATSNVYHAFLTNLAGGQPPNLIGDMLIEASDMDGTVTTGQNVLLYGDFSRYLVVDRIGMQTEFIPNLLDQATGRPSGQRAWLAHWRWNAQCADTNAFRVLQL